MRTLIMMFALLLSLTNQGMAEQVDAKLTERIILKGTLITEWSRESLRHQVYHYKGEFYGCIYFVSYMKFTI